MPNISKCQQEELKDAAKQLKEITPAAMNTKRSKMVTKDVPPTTPGIVMLFQCLR